MYDHKEIENSILDFWKRKKIFQKLMKKNKGKKPWSFIDGPITANNQMGVHHAWGRTYKDVFQRFKAMQGYDQRFQNGFDCQGLWVEVEVEKDLGFNSKKDIEKFGLANFSKACRKRVEKYSKIQTDQSVKLGQWMDWPNSYYTYDDYNIEYIWYFLKRCKEKGWLYQGSNVMPWCVRCGTSLSQHELADTYKEVTHTAVYFKVPIKRKNNEYLLLWSTTPWTFTSNVAAAVHPDLDYAKVKVGNEIYYLAQGTLSCLHEDYIVLDTIKGKKLVGLEYIGPFDYLPVLRGVKHKVIPWKEVSEEEGTGIVHIAPGCGAEDNELAKEFKLEEIAPLDEYGNYIKGFDWLTGKNVKDVTELIIKDLGKRGFLYEAQDYRHRYPFCWRCDEELVFRLVKEWFISVDKIRPLMMKEVRKVVWYPKYVGKLMQDWLKNMQDWVISRKRYWGLPLPIWECSSCNYKEFIATRKELEKKAIAGIKQLKELHKPWIDKVVLKCPKKNCGKKMHRIKEVGDCWLDAGIVPFSTLNYINDKNYWKRWYPAELVVEMREQVRLWFYSLMFMSVTLKGKTPYEKVFAYEKVNDELGRPMHKSLGNAIWFDEAVDKIGADVMRWMYCSHNPQFNLNFGYTLAEEVKRLVTVILNLGNYVKSYCKNPKKGKNLDLASKWITSRRESVKEEVTNSLENLKPHLAMAEIQKYLIDDLSRGYGQLIRTDLEKPEVQATLYNSFRDGLKLLAPFLPFLTERLYQDTYKKKESIFLEDWSKPDKKLINKNLEKSMIVAKEIIQEILAKREEARIGVRWPLPLAKITTESPRAIKNLADIIKKQTNVKKLEIKKGKTKVELNTKLTLDLEKEGFTREVIRRIQQLRKKAGLKKEDKIILDEKTKIDLNYDLIKKVAGAKEIKELKKAKVKDKFKIKGKDFEVSFNTAK